MTQHAIIHTHWLYGKGPDKIVSFAQPVKEETQCSKCSHDIVCAHDMEKRCANYVFGTSQGSGCQSCLHRFTRWDKDAIPCFKCNEFARARA